MDIRQVAILQDNYSHLLVDREAGCVAAVDPAEPEVVLAAIDGLGLPLTHILCTHHHWDHAGGNEGMLARFPDAQVVVGERDAPKVKGVTHRVSGGETFAFGSQSIQVLEVPCHTRGHVAFLVNGALFCGDTLFVAGCGRFFEGDAAEMDEALNRVFGALPNDTQVYCGHEYTVSNLMFAASVEPDNEAIAAKLRWAKEERSNDRSTVPSTIGEEKATNPFMRVGVPGLQALLGVTDTVAAMAALRERKNGFKG